MFINILVKVINNLSTVMNTKTTACSSLESTDLYTREL